MAKYSPEEIIAAAQKLLKERYEKEGHHMVVAAALSTKSGHLYAGIHIGTNQPSLATCAEIVTIGIAQTAEKEMEIDTIVAVRDLDGYVISPCGRCREYISDYSNGTAKVIVPAENEKGWELVDIDALIPNKYKKRPACN